MSATQDDESSYEEGDEYEEYSESEEEEESEDEEEPKLKYHRLGFSVIDILKETSATCMAVHEKFLAMGTRRGNVYILDFNGNMNQAFAKHDNVVTELSIDDRGEFIASCSLSGKISIHSVFGNASDSSSYSFKRPILSIALEPDYYRSNTREFVCGGRSEELVLSKKGLFFGNRTSVLHAGEGPIYAIKWRKSLIAWANDKGVKIFDCQTNQRITYINRPPKSPRPDQYRCCLCWESDDILLIGWADCIKICQIQERRNTASGLPSRYVEIIGLIQTTDYWICGIAPFGDFLVTLAYAKGEDTVGAAPRPELRIITRNNEPISSDALSIHGYEHYGPTDYRLDHMATESLFYVVSPRDIVVAKPRDLDDHITWLLENEKYEEALNEASANQAHIHTHNLIDIGERYLTHLVDIGEISKATAWCPKILGDSEKLWEKWIFLFAKLRQLKAISPYIPIANPQLSQTVYEMVLCYFLNQNHAGFLRTIQEWPCHLYDISNIIQAAEEKTRTLNDNYCLKEALAQLYLYDKRYDKTLEILLEIKKGDVFQLIHKYDLFSTIEDLVLPLMQFNENEAIRLLINNTDRIPISKVVSQLEKNRLYQHKYLHALFVKDPNFEPAAKYHELQVQLYAEYDYKNLMSFLRQSTNYSLSDAKELFEKKKFYPELIFILGITGGQSETALKLIIEELRDVKMAIEFVQEQNDDGLWDSLIYMSIQNPKFLSGFLEHIGAHIDPLKLIERIPNGVEVEGLRDRLVKIISDYNLQMSLREGCNVILKADCVSLGKRLNAGQNAAMKVSTQSKCASCAAQVVPAKEQGGLVIFFCSHVYHQRCLRNAHRSGTEANGAKGSLSDLWCIICQKESQTKKSSTPITRSNKQN